MKKITFLIIMTLITTIGYSQVDTPFDKNHITEKIQLLISDEKEYIAWQNQPIKLLDTINKPIIKENEKLKYFEIL